MPRFSIRVTFVILTGCIVVSRAASRAEPRTRKDGKGFFLEATGETPQQHLIRVDKAFTLRMNLCLIESVCPMAKLFFGVTVPDGIIPGCAACVLATQCYAKLSESAQYSF